MEGGGEPSSAQSQPSKLDAGSSGDGDGSSQQQHSQSHQQQQPLSSDALQQQQPKKHKEDVVTGLALTFPKGTTAVDLDAVPASEVGVQDPTPYLSALRDDHSSLRLVTRALQHCCQFAGQGSQAMATNESYLYCSSSVVHVPSYTKVVSQHVIASITECLQQHKDRTCRILAAQTLALVGQAAYAQLRPSPLLATLRDATVVARLEDEVGAELPTALITAVLQEDDDGVSSHALQALGRFWNLQVPDASSATSVASSATSFGAVVHRALRSLTAPGVAVTAPTVQALVDEDVSIVATELATRCLQTVVVPRLWSVVERVVRYTNPLALARAIPVVTAALCFAWQTSQGQLFGMTRHVHAKQWSTVHAAEMVQTWVHAVLLPTLQQAVQGHVLWTTALAALQLVQAGSLIGPAPPTWTTTLGKSICHVQHEALTATPLSLQHKLHGVATILVASRTVPFPERCPLLFPLVELVLALPSTTRVPLGVLSPGLVLPEYTNHAAATRKSNSSNNNTTSSSNTWLVQDARLGHHTRRPTRIPYWTELALSFFLDGPTPSRADLTYTQTAATAAAAAGPSSSAAASSIHGTKQTAAATAATAAAGGGRPEALKKFFHLATVSSVISDASFSNARSTPLLPRDELLVAFTTVAIACGRRFRGGPVDPTRAAAAAASATTAAAVSWPLTDPSAPAVEEWLQLSWIVLTAFVPCVNMPPSPRKASSNNNNTNNNNAPTYLEEDLSLSTAGLTLYVQLLQEYLHFAGLLHPGSSVALKLVANACPPHLLWDQLSESASFLARLEAVDMGLLDNTTKLLNEIVSREMTKSGGIPSHHMRLFCLALASDHWMQGRVAAIRKQFESTGGFGGGNSSHSNSSGNHSNSIPPLDAASAREIILALSPKRILTKIFQAHVPPVDAEGKKKKDPIKRLTVETVRVCVACIENIALIACDWRKRFPPTAANSNSAQQQEPKHVVSVAVGVLQGKVDETPMNETIKTIMAPICEAAVSRIQSFYESDLGGQDSFPASELVMQNVKTKIKPLVSSSSSKPPIITKDDYARGYLMQLCRSLVQSLAEQAVHSLPPTDTEGTRPARSTNWLRLVVPPPIMAESRDGRVLGHRLPTTHQSFGSTAQVVSAGSDPVALLVAYTPRRYFRHDGEDEFRTTILVHVYNTTNFEFTDGLRLELALVNQGEYHFDHDPMMEQDVLKRAVMESLGLSEDDLVQPPLTSASVVCQQELTPGEYLSWEVALDQIPIGEGICVIPSVTFPNVPKEPVDSGAKWMGEAKPQSGDSSTINTGGGESTGGNPGGEDDFQVTTGDGGRRGVKDTEPPSEPVTIVGEAMPLPPMIQMQPCPLIFLRDRWGDMDAFRLLWFRLPYHVPEIPLALARNKDDMGHFDNKANHLMRALANMSSLVWNGEAIPGGYVTRAWAFSTLYGQRILAVLSESDSDKKLALHFRGDDRHVLYGLVGPLRNRQRVVAALTPEFEPVQLLD